jgi:Tfp pilus assembly protein PilO
MKLGSKEFALLLLLVAVPVSSWWLVFRPQNNQIMLAKQDLLHKQDMLAKLREETARNEDLARVNEQLKVNIAAIEERLPTNKEVDSIVRQVSDLAVQCGLESPQLKSAKPVKAALYMEQPLELETTGDFKGFYQFMLRLEQLQRITRVPDMKLKRHDKENGRLQANFTLSIYFQDEKAQAAPPEPAKPAKK